MNNANLLTLIGLLMLCGFIVVWALVRGCADDIDALDRYQVEPNPHRCPECSAIKSETDEITGCQYCAGVKQP